MGVYVLVCVFLNIHSFTVLGSLPHFRSKVELIRGPGSKGIITLARTAPSWCPLRSQINQWVIHAPHPICQSVIFQRSASFHLRLALLSISNNYFIGPVCSSLLNAQLSHTDTHIQRDHLSSIQDDTEGNLPPLIFYTKSTKINIAYNVLGLLHSDVSSGWSSLFLKELLKPPPLTSCRWWEGLSVVDVSLAKILFLPTY